MIFFFQSFSLCSFISFCHFLAIKIPNKLSDAIMNILSTSFYSTKPHRHFSQSTFFLSSMMFSSSFSFVLVDFRDRDLSDTILFEINFFDLFFSTKTFRDFFFRLYYTIPRNQEIMGGRAAPTFLKNVVV